MTKIFWKAFLLVLGIMALGLFLRSTGLAQTGTIGPNGITLDSTIKWGELPKKQDKAVEARKMLQDLDRLLHNPQTDIPNLVVFAGGGLELDSLNQFRMTAKDVTGVLPGAQRTLSIVTVYPNSFNIKLWLVIEQGEEGNELYAYFPLRDDAVRVLQLGLAWTMK